MTEAKLLQHSIEHLHGPSEIPYAEDELVVVCLVRDGRPYVKSFIEHYFSLGVKHIVFLDNGSSDSTVPATCRYDNVTVLQTKLPFKDYELLMKQYLITRFGRRGRWCLCVDIDELFDYPYSEVTGLDSFLRYLTSKSYTAVMAHMLDMFPEKPLSDRQSNLDEPLKEVHRFYDISNVTRKSLKENPRHLLRFNNTYESHVMEGFRGGVRQTVFGANHNLTKQPLVFLDGTVKPMYENVKWVNNARVADLTCVLFHYKFLDGYFYALTKRNVQEEQYSQDSLRYKKYLAALEKHPSLEIKQETAREMKSVNDLLEDQFLVVSEDYVNWVDAQEEKNRSPQAPQLEAHRPAESSVALRRQERARILKMQRLARQRSELKQISELQSARRRAERRARKLEKQLENMQASRSWKLMHMIHHLRNRFAKRQ